MLDQMTEPAKHAVDTTSAAILLATLVNWLPGITALLVLIWTMMRMYETWLNIGEKRAARRAAAIAAAALEPPRS